MFRSLGISTVLKIMTGEDEEEEEDEVESTEGGRIFNWERFFVIIIPVALVVIAAALAVSIVFMPNHGSGTDNKSITFNNAYDDIETLPRGRHKVYEDRIPAFKIDYVGIRLNFTDAEDFCQRKNSTLVVLFNEREEEYFLKAVSDNGDFLEECQNNVFIGYRMILDEELEVEGIPMLTFTGKLTSLTNMWLEDSFDPKKDCAIIIFHPKSKVFGVKSEPCTFGASCYLCETTHGCPRDYPFCYVWKHAINQTETYSTARTYCTEKKNGHLARLRNQYMLEAMLRQLYVTSGKLFMLYSAHACKGGYYISKQQMDLGPLGFETINESEIKYMSQTIKLDNQPFGAHCLGVVRDDNHEISFSPLRCDSERCFFCRSKRAGNIKT